MEKQRQTDIAKIFLKKKMMMKEEEGEEKKEDLLYQISRHLGNQSTGQHGIGAG